MVVNSTDSPEGFAVTVGNGVGLGVVGAGVGIGVGTAGGISGKLEPKSNSCDPAKLVMTLVPTRTRPALSVSSKLSGAMRGLTLSLRWHIQKEGPSFLSQVISKFDMWACFILTEEISPYPATSSVDNEIKRRTG